MSRDPSPKKSALRVSCASHVVQDGLIASIYVLLPILAQVFGLSYAQVGLLKGLKGLAQALLEIGSGWFSEQIGECRLIAVGLGLSGAGYAILSVAPGLGAVTIALLIIGAGTALHHAPASALIVHSYRANKRTSALGLYNASGDVGKLAFTGGVSLAIGAGLAWHQISLIYGLSGLLAAGVIARAARSLRHHHPQTARQDQSANKGWGILNWRAFASLLAVTSIDTMVQSSTFVFVAFLMLAKGLPLWVATAATVILLAGGVFGKAGCGYLAERIGVRAAFGMIQALTALGLVAIVFVPNWLALTLLLPLGAVAQGSTSITYGFAAGLIHPSRMARGYALLYSSGTFAAAAGPFGIGLVADAWGIGVAICGLAIFALLAVPPIFLLSTAPKSGDGG
ncbi:MAG: MFS transporter [Roseovarius sp.]|nr:MFS transporter [Roseovarius sp.]